MAYTDYLFDFDGTLVDSMPSYAAAMLRLLDEGGIAYGDDIIKRITPLGYLGTARYYVEELGLALPVDEAVERMRRYAYDEYAYRIGAKATVIETLTALAAEGAGLHILTASPHAVLDVCLGRLGMLSLFKNVWSCDDFKTSKADPEIYRMAAARIGRPIDTILFLDDNRGACQTAVSAGMPVCGVYDESSADCVEEIRAIAGRYIYRMDELLGL